jgi:hypothetical protein
MLNVAGVNPVPLRMAVALVTPGVVLEAVRNPCRPPTAEGSKVTTSEQLALAANVVVQFEELMAKSPAAAPAIARLRPDIVTPPGLVTVTAWPASVVPIAVPGKVTVAGVTLSAAGASPVPESATCTGGTPRLVVATVTVPFWLPPTAGAKVTGAWHVAPAAMLVPQLPDPTLKGEAVANESPCRVPDPGLLTVSCIAVLLLPTPTVPNVNCGGVTTSCTVGRPVPVSPTTTGVNPGVVDWMVTEPILVPGPDGENVAAKVHVAPLISCAPQPFWERL